MGITVLRGSDLGGIQQEMGCTAGGLGRDQCKVAEEYWRGCCVACSGAVCRVVANLLVLEGGHLVSSACVFKPI